MSIPKLQMNEEQILGYLDNAIKNWRERVKHASAKQKNDPIYEENLLISRCYVDAFQSMRVSLFGELLPKDPV